MLPDPPRLDLLVSHGHAAARGLLLGRGPGPDGWHGALDAAVSDAAGDDRELLRVADDLHAASADLRTAAAVRAYARSTIATVTGTAARAFLDGMAAAVPADSRRAPGGE